MPTKLFAMTLRLDPSVAEQIEDVSDTLRMTKVQFIRRAIRRSLEHATTHELPLIEARNIREALTP